MEDKDIAPNAQVPTADPVCTGQEYSCTGANFCPYRLDQQQRGWTYSGTRFMDNEDFEADWTPCEALLKKSHVLPSYPVFLRMYVLRLPHREETTEIRSIELRHTSSYFSQNKAGHFFFFIQVIMGTKKRRILR